MAIPLALCCVILYFLISYFTISEHSSPLHFLGIFTLIFSLALFFALFLKFFPLSISFLFCLFVMVLRTMGTPPNEEFGEKEMLLSFTSGIMSVYLLWGFFLANHSKNYQKFLLMIFCFLVYSSFLFMALQNIFSQIMGLQKYWYLKFSFLESNFVSILTLWGFYVIYHTPKEKNFFFALLACFILLSVLSFQEIFGVFAVVLPLGLGLILHPIAKEIFYFGEYILLGLLLLEFIFQKAKKSNA